MATRCDDAKGAADADALATILSRAILQEDPAEVRHQREKNRVLDHTYP